MHDVLRPTWWQTWAELPCRRHDEHLRYASPGHVHDVLRPTWLLTWPVLPCRRHDVHEAGQTGSRVHDEHGQGRSPNDLGLAMCRLHDVQGPMHGHAHDEGEPRQTGGGRSGSEVGREEGRRGAMLEWPSRLLQTWRQEH
jgi:hypothetical protein